MKQNIFTSISAEFDSSFIYRFQISQEYNPQKIAIIQYIMTKVNDSVCFVAKINGSQPLVFN